MLYACSNCNNVKFFRKDEVVKNCTWLSFRTLMRNADPTQEPTWEDYLRICDGTYIPIN